MRYAVYIGALIIGLVSSLWYIVNSGKRRRTRIDYTLGDLKAFNMSLVLHNDSEYLAFVRLGSHNLCAPISPPNRLYSKIGICRIDRYSLQPLSDIKIIEDFGDWYEDPRVTRHRDGLVITTNKFYREKSTPSISMIKGEKIVHYDLWGVYDGTEKNWSAFSHSGKLYLITNVNPFDIYDYEKWERVQHQSLDKFGIDEGRYGSLRAGRIAGRLSASENYLGYFHSRSKEDSYYLFYFVLDSKRMEITQIYGPFDYRHLGGRIQYPHSILLDGDILVISISIDDCYIVLLEENLESIMKTS